jgi:hypothetical protein
MSEINLFNRWKVKRWVFWSVVGGVPALCILTFLVLTILGSSVGSSYDKVVSPLVAPATGGFGGSYPEYEEIAVEAPVFMPTPVVVYVEDTNLSTVSKIPTERLIKREGNISLIVEDTRKSHDQIENIVDNLADKGAFVVNSTENSRGEDLSPNISMVIRVPVEEFDSIIELIAEMAVEVINSNEWAEDVTEEYVDLSNRIESMEAARDRLLEIMQNADNTEDLLQAEAQLTYREADIESLKGRLQYLSQSAKLSRISINLEPYTFFEPIKSKWNPAEIAKDAVETLVRSFQGFVNFLIRFSISALPWFVFFGLIIWGIVTLVRGRRARKAKKMEE